MDQLLSTIYAAAVLLPLASFVGILLFANRLGRFAAWVATSAILGAALLSFLGFGLWLKHHFPPVGHGHSEASAHDADHGHEHPRAPEHGREGKAEGHKDSADHKEKEKTGSLNGPLPAGYVALMQESAAETAEHAVESEHGAHDLHAAGPAYTGEYYTLGVFGPLRVTISYYIDALTVVMFCMVTFIASCIHFYAIG